MNKNELPKLSRLQIVQPQPIHVQNHQSGPYHFCGSSTSLKDIKMSCNTYNNKSCKFEFRTNIGTEKTYLQTLYEKSLKQLQNVLQANNALKNQLQQSKKQIITIQLANSHYEKTLKEEQITNRNHLQKIKQLTNLNQQYSKQIKQSQQLILNYKNNILESENKIINKNKQIFTLNIKHKKELEEAYKQLAYMGSQINSKNQKLIKCVSNKEAQRQLQYQLKNCQKELLNYRKNIRRYIKDAVQKTQQIQLCQKNNKYYSNKGQLEIEEQLNVQEAKRRQTVKRDGYKVIYHEDFQNKINPRVAMSIGSTIRQLNQKDTKCDILSNKSHTKTLKIDKQQFGKIQLSQQINRMVEKYNYINRKYQMLLVQKNKYSKKLKVYQRFLFKIQSQLDRCSTEQYDCSWKSNTSFQKMQNPDYSIKQSHSENIIKIYQSLLLSTQRDVIKLKDSIQGQSELQAHICHLQQKLQSQENLNAELIFKIKQIEDEKSLLQNPHIIQTDQTYKTNWFSKTPINDENYNLNSVQSQPYQQEKVLELVDQLKYQNEILLKLKQSADEKIQNLEWKITNLQNNFQNNLQNRVGIEETYGSMCDEEQGILFIRKKIKSPSDLILEINNLKEEILVLRKYKQNYQALELKCLSISQTFNKFRSQYQIRTSREKQISEYQNHIIDKEKEHLQKIMTTVSTMNKVNLQRNHKEQQMQISKFKLCEKAGEQYEKLSDESESDFICFNMANPNVIGDI